MAEEHARKRLRLAAAVFDLLLVTVVASTGVHAAFAWEEENCQPGMDDNQGHEAQEMGAGNDDDPGHEDSDCGR